MAMEQSPENLDALIRFARQIPKAELHVHFEGSTQPATLLKMARRNGIALPADNVEGLQNWFLFRDFPHFIEVYIVIAQCFQTLIDFEEAAYDFGKNMLENCCVYAEVTFTVGLYKHLIWSDIMGAVNRGRKRAQADFGVDWRWVIDIPRDFIDTAEATTDYVCASEAESLGIVALGLGGSELLFPAPLFEKYFSKAASHGVFSTPHAGETDGPQSVWDCINKLHAQRIGHGVRSIEDPALVEFLVKKQIALEVCPTSNICLKVYADYSAHPLRKLWEQGILMCVNSDDPPLFNCTLAGEYELLVKCFGFTAKEVVKIAVNAATASFLPPLEKCKLASRIQYEASKLITKLGLCESAENKQSSPRELYSHRSLEITQITVLPGALKLQRPRVAQVLRILEGGGVLDLDGVSSKVTEGDVFAVTAGARWRISNHGHETLTLSNTFLPEQNKEL